LGKHEIEMGIGKEEKEYSSQIYSVAIEKLTVKMTEKIFVVLVAIVGLASSIGSEAVNKVHSREKRFLVVPPCVEQGFVEVRKDSDAFLDFQNFSYETSTNQRYWYSFEPWKRSDNPWTSDESSVLSAWKCKPAEVDLFSWYFWWVDLKFLGTFRAEIRSPGNYTPTNFPETAWQRFPNGRRKREIVIDPSTGQNFERYAAEVNEAGNEALKDYNEYEEEDETFDDEFPEDEKVATVENYPQATEEQLADTSSTAAD
jgi:hypothetical protein